MVIDVWEWQARIGINPERSLSHPPFHSVNFLLLTDATVTPPFDELSSAAVFTVSSLCEQREIQRVSNAEF